MQRKYTKTRHLSTKSYPRSLYELKGLKGHWHPGWIFDNLLTSGDRRVLTHVSLSTHIDVLALSLLKKKREFTQTFWLSSKYPMVVSIPLPSSFNSPHPITFPLLLPLTTDFPAAFIPSLSLSFLLSPPTLPASPTFPPSLIILSSLSSVRCAVKSSRVLCFSLSRCPGLESSCSLCSQPSSSSPVSTLSGWLGKRFGTVFFFFFEMIHPQGR